MTLYPARSKPKRNVTPKQVFVLLCLDNIQMRRHHLGWRTIPTYWIGETNVTSSVATLQRNGVIKQDWKTKKFVLTFKSNMEEC